MGMMIQLQLLKPWFWVNYLPFLRGIRQIIGRDITARVTKWWFLLFTL
jgi:hypothetical protein